MFVHSGVTRWVTVACITACTMLLAVGRRTPTASVSIRVADSSFPADGTSGTSVEIHATDNHSLRDLQLYTADAHRLRVDELNVNGDHADAKLVAGVVPGPATIEAKLRDGTVIRTAVHLTLDSSDSKADGTPDFLRLGSEADQEAFRRWFTFIAEAQFFRLPDINNQVTDCAGLIRFAFREALKAHSGSWARTLQLDTVAHSADVEQYEFPFTPLGSSVFRIRPGRFQPGDLKDGTFADFADANTLRRYNTHFISRDVRRAKPGDILFYRQDGQHSPYHAMIFVGRSQFEDGPDAYVVYHTGPTEGGPGELRRPSLRELFTHPEPRWRPLADNPAFLGLYRWNILYGAE